MDRVAGHTTEQRLTALKHACRSAIGDRLRSVTVDSPEWSGTVYRRSDLQSGIDEPVREATTGSGAVLADGGRAVATTGGLKMDREEELSAAVRGVFSR